MAIGTFKLSHKQRKTLYNIFMVLNIIIVLLGLGMTSSSLYIIIVLYPMLYPEKSEVIFTFAVTGIFGITVIIHWLTGVEVCIKCFKQAHKKSTSNFLLLWICVGANTVVSLIIVSHLGRKNIRDLVKSMKVSITDGMRHYLTDITWKETIDKLQYENECCGILTYEDWHEISWLNKYHVNINSETIKQFRISEDNLNLPVTPWSCCRIDFPMQCLHDPIQQARYAHIWVDEPNVVMDAINTKGCFESLKKPIITIINLFVVLSSFVFVLYIVNFIVSRILFTSSRNAIILNDPEGTAPGWIFGRGDCGYARGKTLSEIMANQPPTEEESPEKKKSKRGLGKMFTVSPKRKYLKQKHTADEEKDQEHDHLLDQQNDQPNLKPIEDVNELYVTANPDMTESQNAILNSHYVTAEQPLEYPEFDPKLHSTAIEVNEKTEDKNKTVDDSGEPFSMEAEFKKLEQQ